MLGVSVGWFRRAGVGLGIGRFIGLGVYMRNGRTVVGWMQSVDLMGCDHCCVLEERESEVKMHENVCP